MRYSLLEDAIGKAKNYRDRLVLVYGTSALETIHVLAVHQGLPVNNISMELAERLLTLSRHERTHGVLALFAEWVGEGPTGLQIFTHPEILFDPVLAVDPVRLFLNNARNTTLVVQWPGKVSATTLSYATPAHPEYRSWRITELGQTILINADEYQ